MLLEVQCEVTTVRDDLGCRVICWCWSTVFSEVHSQRSIYQDILEHFMLPSADKLYGDADFIFQQDLAPAHTAKGTKSWFNDHVLLCLIGQQTRLNPRENIWVIVKRKMRDTRPNNADDLKPRESRWETPDPTMQMTWRPISKQPVLHYTWAVPQADCLDATPHWCSNSCKRRLNQVLSA